MARIRTASPEEIERVTFGVSRLSRGYDVDAVDQALNAWQQYRASDNQPAEYARPAPRGTDAVDAVAAKRACWWMRQFENPRGRAGSGLAGLLLALLLFWAFFPQSLLPWSPRKATADGVVTSMGSAMYGDELMCDPVATFVVAGRSYTAPSETSRDPCPWHLHGVVSVRYAPAHPDDGVIIESDFIARLGGIALPVFLALFAVWAFIAAAAGWTLGLAATHRDRRYGAQPETPEETLARLNRVATSVPRRALADPSADLRPLPVDEGRRRTGW